MQTIFIILGSLLATLAVGLGTIGAHALKSQLTVQPVASAAEPVERSVQQRIEARRFPSVFQAWNPATECA